MSQHSLAASEVSSVPYESAVTRSSFSLSDMVLEWKLIVVLVSKSYARSFKPGSLLRVYEPALNVRSKRFCSKTLSVFLMSVAVYYLGCQQSRQYKRRERSNQSVIKYYSN
jgi:hypothetical protein